MESIDLLANAPIQPVDMKKTSVVTRDLENADNKKKMKVAKDFESILIGQLMNQMKETVGDSGLLQDGSSKQIQDMFWNFLSEDVADNGGFGLWKDIYQSMSPDQEPKTGISTENANLKLDQKA